MSCMCGDLCCPSCGLAQGNWQCVICHQWADDPCEHLSEDGQPADNFPYWEYKPEFRELAKKRDEEQAQAEEAIAEELERERKLADEYWRSKD